MDFHVLFTHVNIHGRNHCIWLPLVTLLRKYSAIYTIYPDFFVRIGVTFHCFSESFEVLSKLVDCRTFLPYSISSAEICWLSNACEHHANGSKRRTLVRSNHPTG